MAACNLEPLNPTSTEAAPMKRGPEMNLIDIPSIAFFVPQAIIFGCSAMNRPVILKFVEYFVYILKKQNDFIYAVRLTRTRSYLN